MFLLFIILSGCLGNSGDAGDEQAVEIQDVETRMEEVTSEIPTTIAQIGNPVPPSNESIEAGADTYRKFCSFCHGEGGTGEPVFKQEGKGAFQPADLRKWQDLSDGELFHLITNGVNETEMLPLAGMLTERERWDMINFIRTFEE